MRLTWEVIERFAWRVAGVVIVAVFVASLSTGASVGVSGARARMMGLPFLLLGTIRELPAVLKFWRSDRRRLLPIWSVAIVSCLFVRHWTKDRTISLNDRTDIAFWFSTALAIGSALYIGITLYRRGRLITKASNGDQNA